MNVSVTQTRGADDPVIASSTACGEKDSPTDEMATLPIDNPVMTESQAAQSASAAPCDCEVGEGRQPPTDGKFQPGQSGNPQGRPKGSLNKKTLVRRVLNEKVSFREGDKTRRVTKAEAVLQALTAKAMRGDPRATAVLFNLEDRMGLLRGEESEVENAKRVRASDALLECVDPTLLSMEERAELARLAEIFDRGIIALTAEQFARLQTLAAKGGNSTVH
jgi:hypothetical protein